MATDVLWGKRALCPDFLYIQHQGEAPNEADVVLIWIISLHHKTTVILIELRWSFFDETLWLSIIDMVIVHADGRMTFQFQGGTEIDAYAPKT